jgi:hypothetical protein
MPDKLDLIAQAVMAQQPLAPTGLPAFMGGPVIQQPDTFDKRFGDLPPAGGTSEITRTPPPVEQRFPTPEEQFQPYTPEPQQIVDKNDYTFMDQEADAYQRSLQQQQAGQTPTGPGPDPGTTPSQAGGGGQLTPSLIDTFNPFARLPWAPGEPGTYVPGFGTPPSGSNARADADTYSPAIRSLAQSQGITLQQAYDRLYGNP